MEAESHVGTSSTPHELTIERTFDAPRALVFKMWTQPEHVMRWWGPRTHSCPSCTMDVRVGGAIRLCMRSSEGNDLWVNGVFREVVEPERLVFSATNEVDKAETVITVTFADVAGKTHLTMHQTFARADIGKGAKEGWNSSFDRLVEYLSEAA